MQNDQSPPARPPPSAPLERTAAERRQSYVLLAFGILIAIVVPFLVQPPTHAPRPPGAAMSTAPTAR